jgi:hypothetical protein
LLLAREENHNKNNKASKPSPISGARVIRVDGACKIERQEKNVLLGMNEVVYKSNGTFSTEKHRIAAQLLLIE